MTNEVIRIEWNLSVSTNFHWFAFVPRIIQVHHTRERQIFPINNKVKKDWVSQVLTSSMAMVTWKSNRCETRHLTLLTTAREVESIEQDWRLSLIQSKDEQNRKTCHSLLPRKRATHSDIDERLDLISPRSAEASTTHLWRKYFVIKKSNHNNNKKQPLH